MNRLVLGTRIAQALTGTWREHPPARPSLTAAELATIAPHLLRTGAGGVGWWGVCGTELELEQGSESAAASELHDAFRLQTIQARLHEGRLAKALEILRGVGIQPVLAKGWAVAREYPAVGLRPYGDLDLHVDPAEFELARSALDRHGGAGDAEAHSDNLRVDLHSGVPRLAHSWQDLWARTTEAPLAGGSVRVLGAADHLELLCTHFFEHGAWRPLWLCDIALFVETQGGELVRGAEFVRSAVLLAHELLGARLADTPWAGAHKPLPRWLPRAALRAWGVGGHYSLTTSIALEERSPGALLRSAKIRWPNPIEASVRWGRPFDNTPRLPFQILDVVARSWQAIR